MATEVTRLGVAVDTNAVVAANDDLDKLTKQSKKTEAQVSKTSKNISKDFKKSGDDISKSSKKISKDFKKAETEVSKSSKKISKDFKKSGDAISKTGQKINGVFATITKATAGLAAAYALFRSSTQSLSKANDFNASLAELSTLLEGTPEQMQLAAKEAKRLASTFGGTATDQVKTFYGAISAGTATLAEASELLTTANKLAIGGITSSEIAVDVLTTATASYKASALTATEAADALFVGMKAGKTKVGELGSALEKTIPIAAELGVAYDELVAVVASLSITMDTQVASRGIRAILLAVTKPLAPAKELTEELTKLGKLKYEFSAAGIKEAGSFIEFMRSLKVATGGNADQLTQLFGSVEALIPALALMGEGGAKSAEIMEDMKDKAGEMEAAYIKMAKALSGRLKKAMAKFGVSSLESGVYLQKIYVPIVEAVANNLDRIGAYFKAAAVMMTVYFAPAIAASVIKLGVLIATLITLRGVLVTLGIGILLLAMGELFLLVSNLAKKLGGFGKLWVHIKDIASEVTNRLIEGVKKLGLQFKLFGKSVKLLFQITFSEVKTKFTEFINFLIGGLNKIPKVNIELLEVNPANKELIKETIVEIVDLTRKIKTMPGFTRPLESLEAFNKALDATNKKLDEVVSDESLNDEFEKNKRIAEEAARKLKEQAEAAELLAETMKEKLKPAIDGVANAFADFMSGGISSFKDFTKSILDQFKNLFADMITQSLKEQITIFLTPKLKKGPGGVRDDSRTGVVSAIGGGTTSFEEISGVIFTAIDKVVSKVQQVFGQPAPVELVLEPGVIIETSPTVVAPVSGTVNPGSVATTITGIIPPGTSKTPGVVEPASGGDPASVASNVPLINLVAGILGSILSQQPGAVGNLATLGTYAIFAGITAEAAVTAGLVAVAAGTGKAASATTSTVAAWAGPIGWALVAIAGLLSFFSKKEKVTGRRLNIVFSGDKVSASTETDIKSTTFWGLSSDRTTRVDQIRGEFASNLEKFSADNIAAFSKLGGQFGAGKALEDFAAQIRFSTKGLSQSEIDTRIERELDRVRETMAAAIVGSNDFVREGESFTDAAVRMALAISTVNPIFERMGLNLFYVTRSGANAASTLVELVGGINNFIQATDFFFNNFFSANERIKVSSKLLFETLDELGINAIPESRKAFRALVEQMQLIGDTDAVATLLQLGPLFVEVSDNIEVVNNVFKQLNLTLFDLSKQGIESAGTIVELTGGIGQFTTTAGFYLSNFFTESEQLAISTKTLDDALAGLYLSAIPKTRDEFRSLVDQLLKTPTLDNLNFVAVLLKIAPLFIEIVDATKKATEALDDYIRSLTDARIAAENLAERRVSEALAAQERAERARSEADKAFETLTKARADAAQDFADTLLSVNRMFGMLRLSLIDISSEGIDTSQTLVEMLGGLSGFNSAAEFYFENFFSASEQLAANSRTLSATLFGLGAQSIPRSTAEFRALVEQMQLIGDTGAVAELFKIAPLFIEIADAANKAAEANTRLFETRADETFAGGAAPQVRTEDRGELDRAILRQIVSELRNGNVTIAANTHQSARSLKRMEFEREDT